MKKIKTAIVLISLLSIPLYSCTPENRIEDNTKQEDRPNEGMKGNPELNTSP